MTARTSTAADWRSVAATVRVCVDLDRRNADREWQQVDANTNRPDLADWHLTRARHYEDMANTACEVAARLEQLAVDAAAHEQAAA